MQILLVEDNPAEARLTIEALGEIGIEHELFTVDNGDKATHYLRKEYNYSKANRPDLIFLDLNLPGKDGRDVLRDIKSDPLLSSIPVIVITNSSAQEDIDTVYSLRANCYLVKPPDIDEFFSMMKRVVDFWWFTAELPENRKNSLRPEVTHESSF